MVGARQHLRYKQAAYAASMQKVILFGADWHGVSLACPSPLQHDASKLTWKTMQQLAVRVSTWLIVGSIRRRTVRFKVSASGLCSKCARPEPCKELCCILGAARRPGCKCYLKIWDQGLCCLQRRAGERR